MMREGRIAREYFSLRRKCRCGHTLGQHSATHPNPCAAPNCECMEFSWKRVPAKSKHAGAP